MKGESFLMFLAGAAAGTAIAMLYAPASGREVRGRLKEMLEKELDDKLCHCGEKMRDKGQIEE